MKGLYKIRPSKAKYNTTWDPSVVLDYLATLEPLISLSLKDLTLKTVTLLSMCTAHRVQTLAAIERSDIHVGQSGIEIFISAQIKTSKHGRKQPTLVLPFFDANPSLCAARCVLFYAEKTKSLENDDKLFRSLTKESKSVTSQTISRWIKHALKNAGINTNVFGAHSVRHAATSHALKQGVSIDTIRERAGWSENSSVFARFYNRPIDRRNDFVMSILSPSN